MRLLWSFIVLMALALPGFCADWHHPLYLGNGGYWKQRIAITIRNDMDHEATGEPVNVAVGSGAAQADIAGQRAEALRVCNEMGQEMLFDVISPTGAPVRTGPIPEGSSLVIPAECAAGADALYYAYFDNPAAWGVPDFLQASLGVLNGGMEEGAGVAPDAWNHDAGDEKHQAMWVSENPRSGKKCLKTVVAEGAEPTWIATRQGGIHIVGGAQYRMTAWVKAENVKGNAGWYIHVGNEQNYMIISPMLNGGEGTYDWKQVTAEFVAPDDANRADLGTVLRGTGTAWFDDVTLETVAEVRVRVTSCAREALNVTEIGQDAPWFDDNPEDNLRWDCRVPVRVFNPADQAMEQPLVFVDTSIMAARMRGMMNFASVRVTDAGKLVPHYEVSDRLLFEGSIPAKSIKTYYVYFSSDPAIKAAETSDYAGLLASDRNLVRNPSFEEPGQLPDGWPGGAEGVQPDGTEMTVADEGLFGSRAARMSIPKESTRSWTGWRQAVPVQPFKSYFLSGWLKTENVTPNAQIHAHYRNAEGELCESRKFTSIGPALSGTNDWALMAGLFEMPEDIATFQVHLTMNASGTVWHDGIVLAEAVEGTVGSLEGAQAEALAGLAVWPVNAVVKVFPDDIPPRQAPATVISCARNEKEPLQLALRSPRDLTGVKASVVAPVNAAGARLDDVEINVVGFVPIDHKTSYYSTDSPAWHRKYPTSPGACDGWPGMWPDPLLPTDTFDLPASATQPVWVTVSVPENAAPGDYFGSVRFQAEGLDTRVPFTVHVWDFALPNENHVKAIYDVRQNEGWWQVPGQTRQETLEQFWRFMADHRTNPHQVYPAPSIRYENGQVIADFEAFDRAAQVFFNELGMKHSYTPWYFYCFGWGHPPGEKFGEAPYPGEYPYEGVDRAVLRPEFKTAYQACLGAFWDHLKEKGWDDRFTLYISDEPYDHHEHIIKQMQALCDMIHEVDPAIPIYCSTWRHIPAWNGYLDVWGIGHYGGVPVDVIQARKEAGDTIWWTTDGQMCTDTPYCAVERLLPHYCFKYGAEAYEFWGIDWLTYNPYEYGWHRYIHQSGEPGEYTWVRYPNGDGFLAYPGSLIGHPGPVSSVRLAQAREGVEDYEYLYLLRDLVAKGKAAGKDVSAGEAALELASSLVEIPNAGGRYSTKILPEPQKLYDIRESVAKAIEGLK